MDIPDAAPADDQAVAAEEKAAVPIGEDDASLAGWTVSAPEDEALASAQADQSPAASPPRSRNVLGQIVRGALRPLLILVTSQYVIVTVLIVIAAMTLSREASDLINDKFDAIARALKQYQY